MLTLSGDNTYTGTTLVHEGTLQLGASEVLDDESTLIVAAGGTLDLQGYDETVAEMEIFGTVTGTGTLGAASYEFYGGTINMNLGTGDLVNFGGTTLLNGTSAASLVVVLGGTLQTGADERLLDSALVEVVAGAELDLAGHDETIGGLIGEGLVDLGVGMLRIGGGDLSTAFTGEITGNGGIEKIGDGLFILAGRNSFSGATTVGDGELRLLSDTTGDVVVEGGLLSGSAAIGGALVLTGGMISPGVDGMGFFQAASFTATNGVLLLDVGPDGSDGLLIEGAATLSGGLVDINLQPETSDGSFRQYVTLISAAGGVSGTFDNAADFTPSSDDATLLERLNYGSDSVILELRQLIDFTTTSGHLTGNALAAATALNATEMQAGDAFAGLLDALSTLPAEERGSAIASLSGEGAANGGTSVALLSGGFVDQLGQRIRATGRVTADLASTSHHGLLPERLSGDALAFAGNANGGEAGRGPGLWLKAYTFDTDLDGKHGQADLASDGDGVVGGVDFAFGIGTLGAAAGYSRFDATTDGLATRSDGKAWQIGGYASFALGGSQAGLVLSYVDADVDTERNFSVGPMVAMLEGRTDIRVISAEINIGHDLHLSGDTVLTLGGSLRGSDIRQGAYVEQGNDILGLSHEQINRQFGIATAGAELRKSFALSGGARLRADAGGGLSVAAGDRSTALRSTFIGAPDGTGAFSSTGASLPSSWGSLGGGLSLASADDSWEFGVRYDGRHGSRLSENRVSAGFSLHW